MLPAPSDWSDELTVFVISTGEDTLEECLSALGNQGCSFRLERICGLYPMSRAFQAMPERSRTRYFVQVDADMVLYPHAIRTLYEGIRDAGVLTYMVYGQLYEEGFGPGGAVKCWKRSVFRFFGFRDVRTVDRDLFRRAAWLGLKRRGLGETLGVHRPRHSVFSEYLKSKSDVEKWRYMGRPVSQFALPLLEKHLGGLPGTGHQLLGALLGALTSGARLARSKDIGFERQLYDRIVGLLDCQPAERDSTCMSDEWCLALRRQFCDGYAAASGTAIPARTELAKSVVGLFSGGESDGSVVEWLLDLTGR